MMGDGFAGATAAGLFWTVNVLLSTSCNKQGQHSNGSIFMVLFPMLFEVSQNRMCREN